VGTANYILHGVHIPVGMGNFYGEGRPIVNYRDMLCDYLCKNGRTYRDAVWVVGLDGPSHRHRWSIGISMSDGDPDVPRDVAMITNFGTQFAITGFL